VLEYFCEISIIFKIQSNPKMKHLQPPHEIEIPTHQFSVFLAGSIDNGKAEFWQDNLVSELAESEIVILNPRRSDWDSSWEPVISNPLFKAQVEWELEGLERSDMIVLYFAPKSQAPISLLELGLFADSDKIVVCCPEGYWRKGNVDVVCQKYGIKQVADLEELKWAILDESRKV
jgi:hypothetical protein